MKKIFDYNKEQSRGTLKQIMKVRGLRTISIANYVNWLNSNGKSANVPAVHSLKLDLQDGYINAYGWNGNKCGEKIEDLSASDYTAVCSSYAGRDEFVHLPVIGHEAVGLTLHIRSLGINGSGAALTDKRNQHPGVLLVFGGCVFRGAKFHISPVLSGFPGMVLHNKADTAVFAQG